jgi:hypothetical protein
VEHFQAVKKLRINARNRGNNKKYTGGCNADEIRTRFRRIAPT